MIITLLAIAAYLAATLVFSMIVALRIPSSCHRARKSPRRRRIMRCR